MNLDKKEKWKCKVCRSKINRSELDEVDASADIISPSDSSQLAAQILEINRKLDSLLSLKVSVDSLLELPGKINELLLLKPTIDLMKSSVEEVKSSISFLSEKYDDSLLVTATAHATEIIDLQTEMGALRSTVSEQPQIIQCFKTELNEADQHARLQNMEIQGLKTDPSVSLVTALDELAEELEIEGHESSDIVSAFKIPIQRCLQQPILVKFTSVAVKDR